MSPLEFLQALWPDQGYYCIAAPYKKKGVKDLCWWHEVFDTIEQAAEFCEKEKLNKNIFFCMNTLREKVIVYEDKINRKTKKPKCEWRTHENMMWVRCFFFDLDVGESTPKIEKYDSQENAVIGLTAFLKATGLPKPICTSSGGGVHVFWPLEDKMTTLEWVPHATKLKALAFHHGLKFDPARVNDQSSVLRVAGTFNLKDEPRPVEVRISGETTPNADFLRIINDAFISAGLNEPVPPKLVSNIKREYTAPPPTMKALLSSCNQIRTMMNEPGEVSQTGWYAGIQAMRHIEDGVKWAHIFSAKRYESNSRYTPEYVEEKLSQLEEKDIGPTTCQHLRDICGPAECNGCPWIEEKSPVVAARKWMKQQGTAIPVLSIKAPPAPEPYKFLDDGGIGITTMNGWGKEYTTKILDYNLYPLVTVHNKSAKQRHHRWVVELPHYDTPQEFEIYAPSMCERRAFYTALSNEGIYVANENLQHVMDFMTAYIKSLQKLSKDDTQYTHLGWTEERDGFILPDKLLKSDGTEMAVHLTDNAEVAAEGMRISGTVERQIELLKFYNYPKYTAHQFYIMAGMAAPIFHTTSEDGVVLHMWGETGGSKSSALYAVAGFWGAPKEFYINGTKTGATATFRNEKITALANLPVCVDEICFNEDDANDIVKGATQPGHRRRSGNDGKLRKAPSAYKSTIMLTTANKSLHAVLSQKNASDTAGSMRVVEFLCLPAEKYGHHTKQQANAWKREILLNYGFLGPMSASYMVQNLPDIKHRVWKVMDEFEVESKITAGERFWSAVAAVGLVQGEIALAQGWLSYNVEFIRKFLIEEQIPFWRDIVKTEYSSASGILADYLESINDMMLVLDSPRNSNKLGDIKKHPHGKLVARHERDAQLLWVLKKDFKDYCIRNGVSYLSTLRQLKDEKIVTDMNNHKCLGANTEQYEKVQTWCFIVNTGHKAISAKVEANVVANNPDVIPTPPKRGHLIVIPPINPS